MLWPEARIIFFKWLPQFKWAFGTPWFLANEDMASTLAGVLLLFSHLIILLILFCYHRNNRSSELQSLRTWNTTPVCGFFESISNQSFWQDYQQDYVVLLQCPPTCPPCYMGSDLDKGLKCLAWHISPQAWWVLYYQQTETPILWWSGEGQILTEATLTLFVYANKIYVDKMILHSDCGASI